MIAVALSGGADSLRSLIMLKEQGHEVLALHGTFFVNYAQKPDHLARLESTCRDLNVPLHIINLQEDFANLVIKPFLAAYLAGYTPNPCIHCNATIKFGALYAAAKKLGADKIATGHYAKIEKHNTYGYVLCAGADSTKDQSYFLAQIASEKLPNIVFPLANITKKEVLADLQARKIAVPIAVESQDICFVPENNYRQFIKDHSTVNFAPGSIILQNSEQNTIMGQHSGLWHYTEGQRRGLGIAYKEPLYVLRKDIAANILYVGTKSEVSISKCRVGQLNYFVPTTLWPQSIYVKIRYRQKSALAKLDAVDENLYFTFTEPQALSAPGQGVVFYDQSGYVLAGGILLSAD